MYNYEIGLLQQLKLLSPMFFKNLAVIILVLIFSYLDALFIVFIIMLVIDIIPTLIVHIQYLLKNKGRTLTIDINKRTISFNNPGNKNQQYFDDIISLERYASFVRPTGWHSFGEYRYYKIIFNDKTEFIITCVLVPDIENNLATFLPLEAKKHDRLIALIY
jgi:hypothetical protein